MELMNLNLQDGGRPVCIAVATPDDVWRIQRYINQSDMAMLQLEMYDELTGRKKMDQQEIAKEMEAQHG